jgi:hypothetical protein
MDRGAPQTCPACGLLSPPSALRCDCGFDFQNRQGGDPAFTLRGLSGWLFLVGVGLCISLVRSASDFVQLVKGVRSAWPVLTTPGTSVYHWLAAPLLASELVVGIVFLGWTVLLVYLFFRKKKRFSRSAIAFMVVSVIWVVADFAVALTIPVIRRLDHTVQIAAIAQGLVGAAIWIPYFSKSKRVQATFVE